MSDQKKRESAAKAMAELDLRLDGLLGALGSTLSEVIDRLEDAGQAEFHNSRDIKTDRGPLRAETGVRVRFAGQDLSPKTPQGPRRTTSRTQDPSPKARNAPEAQRSDGLRSTPATRTPDVVSYTNDGKWFLCADLPGVAESELGVEIDAASAPPVVRIRTSGARVYAAEAPLPPQADPASLSFEIRNGVLEASVALIEPENHQP